MALDNNGPSAPSPNHDDALARSAITADSIEKYRRKLLDTSGRNPLISFRHSDRSKKQIRIIDEVPDFLFKRLESGIKFTFLPLRKPEGIEPEDERTKEFRAALREGKRSDAWYLERKEALGRSPSRKALNQIEGELRDRIRATMGLGPIQRSESPDPDEIARQMGLNPSFELPRELGKTEQKKKHLDSSLQTLIFDEELDARLGSIYQQSQLEEAERGISTLHLALGFLEWYESDDSDEKIFSPLLLFPVDLERTRDGARIKFFLKSRDEDVLVNLSLKERLLRDFHFVVPELQVQEGEDSETESPESYFQRFESALENMTRWKIHRWGTLSFFSFVRLALHQDLDPKNWPPSFLSQHKGLVELFTSQDRENLGTVGQYDEREILTTPCVAPLHIADADSSQLNALIQALSGANMVIDGPPGTGKSQTITNLIAAALAKGSRVLFVCEKLAALKVVKKRLEEAELGQFCLELHSSKARKAEVLSSLQERLAFGQKHSPAGYEQALSDLEELKTTLNDYCRTMNTPLEDDGPTLFEVLGQCVSAQERLKDVKELLVKVKIEAKTISRFDIPAIQHALADCESTHRQVLERIGNLDEFPFTELVDSSCDIFSQESLLLAVRKVNGLSLRCLEGIERLKIIGLPLRCSVAVLRTITSDLAKLGRPPKEVPPILVFLTRHTDGEIIVRRMIDELRATESLRTKVAAIFSQPDALNEAVTHAMAAVGAAMARLNLSPGGPVVGEVNASEKRLVEQQAVLTRLEFVIPKLGISSRLSSPELKAIGIASELAEGLPSEAFELFSNHYLAQEADAVLREGELRAQELLGITEDLARHLTIDFDADPKMLARNAGVLKTAGFFARFGTPFKVARTEISASLRPSVKMKPQQLAVLATRVADLIEETQEFASSAKYSRYFDQQFDGIRSPFRMARVLTAWIKKVRQGLSIADPFESALRDLLLSGNQDHFDLLREASRQRLFVQASEILKTAPGADMRDAVQRMSEELAVLRKRLPILLSAGMAPSVTAQGLADHSIAVERFIENRDFLGDGERSAMIHPSQTTEEKAAALESTLSFVGRIQMVEPSVRPVLLQPAGLAAFEELRPVVESVSRDSEELENHLLVSFRQDLIKGPPLVERPIQDLRSFFERAEHTAEGLSVYLAFLVAREKIATHGVSAMLDAFDVARIPYSDLGCALEFIWSRSIIRSALSKHPSLSKFFGIQHEEARRRFAQLDRQCLRQHQKHLISSLTDKYVPDGVRYGKANEITEKSLIEREIKKKKRHIPLRKLISRAGTAVQALKPCFMMSPLSVAQFLAPGTVNFDLVVMDESSQIRPEDALGAIARGAQVVIVGDPKQLPPTNFFNRLELEVDEGDEDEVEATSFDSVLDLAQSWRKEGLRWHYRSRHQSLIAFSNRHFYDDDLVVFPGPHEGVEDFGVRFINENGKYVAHRNIEEARRIVAEVLSISVRHPKRSIGVVSVNQEQRDLISDLFDDVLRHNTSFREYVERWEKTLEPFFVKNLENVQGDERDTIIISCVYGKDADGNFYRRFGPINSLMGHRRLNVLFTRSKYQMIVVASFEPEDLVLEDTAGPGIRAFKGFLEYAKTGKLPPTNRHSAQSPEPTEFEKSVKRSLEVAGYELEGQVGVAGYFIDLAVRDPKSRGRFLLGIECDGATYHSARSARDRDRLRQEILENLGWKIHRIWSVDWFRNPRKEIERLRKIIEDLLSDTSIASRGRG